uniref:Uncharacterized protein n=1 Tax=Podoviridae sp. ctZkC8 TaxID=2825259 RepID=A0A8S5UC07_9CAUD|nr:MAG TPA: hypothetical protein [Podoviridae sp. ctZkC8]
MPLTINIREPLLTYLIVYIYRLIIFYSHLNSLSSTTVYYTVLKMSYSKYSVSILNLSFISIAITL